jgi:hypothetical protein
MKIINLRFAEQGKWRKVNYLKTLRKVAEQGCGARKSASSALLRKFYRTPWKDWTKTMRSKRGACGATAAERPPIPPYVFLRNTWGGVLRGTPGRRMT